MRVIAISYLLLGSAAALPATSYLQHVNLQSGWRSVWSGDTAGTQYITGSVKTDEVVKTVMATGTLAPALNIEVGSMLSGQVSKLLVDFNDKVTKGQVLAELDDKTYVLA